METASFIQKISTTTIQIFKLFPNSLLKRRQSYNTTGKLTKKFWNTWRNEYLMELRDRHKVVGSKSRSPEQQPHIGDLVILDDDSQLPRGQWPMTVIADLVKSREAPRFKQQQEESFCDQSIDLFLWRYTLIFIVHKIEITNLQQQEQKPLLREKHPRHRGKQLALL
ncbi:hypothetical protein V3C99_017997 [Haemonchus contortus]|uniref:DUF5641 domain-containing protein n=1 Tax=Haemonchus contortus TaxID=6289 RepID=A0A7I4Z2M8_HAECO